MAENYKQLLLQLGFNAQELEMFIKEQKSFSIKAQQIGEFNNKYFGHSTRPTVYTYKSLYDYVTTAKGATPEKPFNAETSRRVIREIEKTQKKYAKTMEEDEMSPQASQLLNEAIKIYNKFAISIGYKQVDISSAKRLSVQHFDGDYSELESYLDEALILLLAYENEDAERGSIMYSHGRAFYNGINMLYEIFTS